MIRVITPDKAVTLARQILENCKPTEDRVAFTLGNADRYSSSTVPLSISDVEQLLGALDTLALVLGTQPIPFASSPTPSS